MAPTGTLSLKLLVDTKAERVLFAEAGKDIVDSLFNMLSLPLGTVTGLLEDMVGSLGNLYDSLENLSDTYMQSTANKHALLKPVQVPNNAETIPPLLLPNLQSATTSTDNFYRCGNSYSSCRNYVTNDSKSICPTCKGFMSIKATFVTPPKQGPTSSDEGGYVKGVVTYMITDDLVVSPMSAISCITLLNKFNVKEVGALEERVIDMGLDEGLKLLKASMESKTVLTDVFIGKKVGKSNVNDSHGGISIVI